MKTLAAFPGSFDPPTRAHRWILEQARNALGDVVVLVATNGTKGRGLLMPEQRVRAWHTMTDSEVVLVDGKKAITQELKERRVTTLVRGIRGTGDVEPEQAYLDFVHGEIPDLQVVHFMVPKELRTISSTIARSIVGLEGWHMMSVPYLSAGVVLTIARALEANGA